MSYVLCLISRYQKEDDSYASYFVFSEFNQSEVKWNFPRPGAAGEILRISHITVIIIDEPRTGWGELCFFFQKAVSGD